jgi:rRNA maturation protein Nop10
MKHKYQRADDAIQMVEYQTGTEWKLLPCPHCGHSASLSEPQKDPDRWGGYRWTIVCSSSHCRAAVNIVADGWYEQIDGELNKHIPADELYRDRVTNLRDKWNRRVAPAVIATEGGS